LAISLQGEQKNNAWQGRVNSFTIDTKKIGSWEVKQPSLFAVTSKEITIDETCLTSALAEEICTSGAYAFNSKWTVASNIQHLSTQTLQNLVGQKNLVQGYFQGSLNLSGQKSNFDKGQLTIAMVDAAIGSPVAAEVNSLQSIQGNVSATYVNHELKAASQISFGDGSYLNTDVTVTVPEEVKSFEAFDLAMLPINGQMIIQVEDVAAINVFMEEHAKISGMVQGALKIEGNIKQPIITGDIQLTQGTAHLFPLGVTLDPLEFKAQVKNNQLALSAKAHSGTGELSATGSVYLDKGLSQELHFLINGTGFEALNNDEMQVVISPNLVVERSNGFVSVTGTITFPEAHISYQGQEGKITPSSDVVIVDADNNIRKSDTPLPLKTSITLIAGDAVDIDAYGLKGILKGQLHLTDISGELPLGTGTLLVNNGSFTLYGRRLDIDVGRLLFSGGPLDNPGIEVRTEKRDDGTTVGMEVGGFLQHPEIRFYSSAAMEQYEILTRLIASSSSSTEVQDQTGVIGDLATKIGLPQLGEALQSSKNLLSIDDIRLDTGDLFDDISLIIGTWLTPRFYVSYGHSLLKDSASFNTRYTIGKNFFFHTETGTTQNGGDIIYEVER
jgi:translocation and assembly module TamB